MENSLLTRDQSVTVDAEKMKAKDTSRTQAVELSRRSKFERIIFVLPAFLFQLIWSWVPIVMAFVLSFTSARVKGPNTFVGFENYIRVFSDPMITNLTLPNNALRVTFLYAFLTIALTFILPIIAAIFILEMKPRVQRLIMLLWFLPISSVASTILWKYMYNREYGLLQAVVTGLGFGPMQFLNSSKEQLFWLIFPSIVLFTPGIFYITTLQSVPRSYYEAAEIEGASVWRKIWTISLPRLRPMISMFMILALIDNLQVYDWPQLMTGGGGPGGTARTMVMYMLTFVPLHIGTGTAIAILLFGIIMGCVVLSRAFLKEDPDA